MNGKIITIIVLFILISIPIAQASLVDWLSDVFGFLFYKTPLNVYPANPNGRYEVVIQRYWNGNSNSYWCGTSCYSNACVDAEGVYDVSDYEADTLFWADRSTIIGWLDAGQIRDVMGTAETIPYCMGQDFWNKLMGMQPTTTTTTIIPSGGLLAFCTLEEFKSFVKNFQGTDEELVTYADNHCAGFTHPIDGCPTQGGGTLSASDIFLECRSNCGDHGLGLWFGIFARLSRESTNIIDIYEVCPSIIPPYTTVTTIKTTTSIITTTTIPLLCSSDLNCMWCGDSCILARPGIMCIMIAPPEGYKCVCGNGNCQKISLPTTTTTIIPSDCRILGCPSGQECTASNYDLGLSQYYCVPKQQCSLRYIDVCLMNVINSIMSFLKKLFGLEVCDAVANTGCPNGYYCAANPSGEAACYSSPQPLSIQPYEIVIEDRTYDRRLTGEDRSMGYGYTTRGW